MDTLNQTKTITVQTFDLLTPDSQKVAIENYRAKKSNFDNFNKDLRDDYLLDFFEELSLIGIHITNYNFEINLFDGCKYNAPIDIKLLLESKADFIKKIYPDEYYNLHKNQVLTEDIPDLLTTDPDYFDIRYICNGIYDPAIIYVEATEGQPVPNSWKRAITDYINEVCNPLNRGLLKELQGAYFHSRSNGAIKEILTASNRFYTSSGIMIRNPSDL